MLTGKVRVRLPTLRWRPAVSRAMERRLAFNSRRIGLMTTRLKQRMLRKRWIVKVTGHAATAAAAEGECSLQVALRSGEALCDLVNAVWPGRIVGILRGEVKPYLQIENV